MADSRPDPLRLLDLAQTRAAAVIGAITLDDLDRPTPCTEWSVRDVINKMVASTMVFTSFGRREKPDPTLDLIHPKEIIGNDPLGVYLTASLACREAWRAPGAMDGLAPSTQGEFPAKSVINARIFDTTILSWDVARATGVPHGIDDEQAAYVLRIAQALVGLVRGRDQARYAEPIDATGAPLVDQMVAATGRNPAWRAAGS